MYQPFMNEMKQVSLCLSHGAQDLELARVRNLY